jgi:hypothetical protein
MSNLTNEGLVELAAALASRYERAFIGIGSDTTTAFDPSQTELVGATTVILPCNSVVAQGTSVTFTAEADFDTANQAWGEMSVELTESAGPMLARKSLGTLLGAKRSTCGGLLRPL